MPLLYEGIRPDDKLLYANAGNGVAKSPCERKGIWKEDLVFIIEHGSRHNLVIPSLDLGA